MNYPDEDYVRFYTRDTITWLALEWEGQCVLSLMLHGRFNRSGIFDCGGHDPSHAVTLATRCPLDVAQKGVARLLETKTWVLNNGQLIWPNYVLAQTCKRSDRARKRESRENLALEAMGQESHAVTRGHTRSHAVTPKPKPKQKPKPKPKQNGESERHPEPIEQQPSETGDAQQPLTLQERSQLWFKDKDRASYLAPHPETWPEVLQLDDRLREVFKIDRKVKITHWEDPRAHHPMRLWAAGISQQDLLDALDGAAVDPYFTKYPAQRSQRWIFEHAERVHEFVLKKPRAMAAPHLPKRRPVDPAEEALASRKREQNRAALAGASSTEVADATETAKAVTNMAGSLFRG